MFFLIEKEYILIDLNLIFPTKPSELKIPISVESYDEKTAEKLPKLLCCRKAHSFQSIKDIQNLISQIEDANEDFVKISSLYLFHFLRNKPS